MNGKLDGLLQEHGYHINENGEIVALNPSTEHESIVWEAEDAEVVDIHDHDHSENVDFDNDADNNFGMDNDNYYNESDLDNYGMDDFDGGLF